MRWVTTEEKDKRKQYGVGCGIGLGAIISVLSLIVGYALTAGSVHRATYTRDPINNDVKDIGVGVYIPIAVLMFVGGLLLSIGSLVYGIMQEKTKNEGPRKVIQNARIIARFAIDRSGMLQTDESQFEFLENLRFYVRIMSPAEGSLEYECSEAVFYGCGEGMMGDAEVQGRWIGAFRPYVGAPVTHVGQRF